MFRELVTISFKRDVESPYYEGHAYGQLMAIMRAGSANWRQGEVKQTLPHALHVTTSCSNPNGIIDRMCSEMKKQNPNWPHYGAGKCRVTWGCRQKTPFNVLIQFGWFGVDNVGQSCCHFMWYTAVYCTNLASPCVFVNSCADDTRECSGFASRRETKHRRQTACFELVNYYWAV